MVEPNAHYELHESRGREPDQDEGLAPSRAGDPDTAAVEVITSATYRPRAYKEELEGYPWIA